MTDTAQNPGPLFKHSKEKYPWFDRCTILRGLVGSTAHGLHTGDGSDDRDEMGVCVEPLSVMMGNEKFEQMIYRSAAEREGRQDATSYAGDLDLTVYSLEKWTRLALQGNPTTMLLLFLPQELCVTRTNLGAELQALAPHFVTRKAGFRFERYLDSQRKQMLGTKGGVKVHRPELIEKYGFDTKSACHTLRLGMQGIEFLTTGRMQLPMEEGVRAWLRGVRVGMMPKQEVLNKVAELQTKLLYLTENSTLPMEADSAPVWKWVRSVYLNAWQRDAEWCMEFNKEEVTS